MGLEHVVLGLVGWSALSVVAAVAWARVAVHARAGLPAGPALDDDRVHDDVPAALLGHGDGAPVPLVVTPDMGDAHVAADGAPPRVEADAAALVSDALGESAWVGLGALQDRIAGRRAARRAAGADAAAAPVDAVTDVEATRG